MILFVCITIKVIAQPNIVKNNAFGPATILASFVDSKTNKPIEYVTVSLIKTTDSVIVNGTSTTKKGEIKLENIAFGTYKLKATFIGYKALTTPAFYITTKELINDLGIYKLEPNNKNLKTVEIVGERNDFNNQLDKKTYTVGKNITNIGGSATDILQNIPSVNVDIDGKISLRGSENVTVLIDGKPSTLTGANRQAILQQLPANAISEVEIITNPSAKYDADGMAGIINIKTKKDKLKGFNANTQVTTGTNDKYSFNIGLNNRTTKYNLFGNYSFRHERRDNFGNSVQYNRFDSIKYSFKNNNSETKLNDFHIGRIGIDYFLNNHNTITFSTGISSNKSTEPQFTNFDYYDSSGNKYTNFNRKIYSIEDNLTIDGSLDYKRSSVKNKSEITSSISLSSNTKIFNQFYNNSNAFNFNIPAQHNLNNATFTNFIAQVDYIYQLKNGKFETGAKNTNRIIDNNQQGFRYDFGNGEYWKDSKISNHFIYNENITAAYAIYTGKK